MAIDRDHAIRTALRLLDEDGLEKLSLRRIAAELDVRAPALYWHFANKRALLDHMTDLMLGDAVPPPPDTEDVKAWPEWLLRTAGSLREALLRHTDGPSIALGANLSRAINLGTIVDRTTEILHRAGFGLTDASRAGGSFIWLVVGRTVEEQALPELDPAALEHARTLFPTLAEAMLERQKAGDTQEAAFRFSVNVMITGLRATLERPPSA